MLDFLPLFLNKRVSAQSSAHPDDIIVAKRSLQRLGYYKPWDGELNSFTDNALFDGIKAFQQDHELTVDGYMDPDGETATEIGRFLFSDIPTDHQEVEIATTEQPSPRMEQSAEHEPKEAGEGDPKRHCEESLERDLVSCAAVGARRGKEAFERCRMKAMQRYAHCLSGKSMSTLPPLDIYDWPSGDGPSRRRRRWRF